MVKRLVKGETVPSTTETEETAPGQTGGDGFSAAYIPTPDLAKKYRHRKIGGVQDFSLLDYAMATKQNVLLMGDTGAGKTMVGAAYASEKAIPYYSLPCDVSIDPSALFGKMSPTDRAGEFEWVDGPVTQLVRSGGVLNISEINFMPPKIAASLYPLLDGRRYVPLLGHKGEVVHAHPNLLVIADMNPNYRGTVELNAAFKNRFPLKVVWNYDDGVEKSLVAGKTLRDCAKQLRDGGEVRTPISTNLLMEFERMVQEDSLTYEFAVMNFLNAFAGSEREAVKNVMELRRTEIERDYRPASVPSDDEDIVIDEDEFIYIGGEEDK